MDAHPTRVMRSTLARWHAHVNALQTSQQMTQWLAHRGSLTARLIGYSDNFRVQRLQQRVATCLSDEFAAIGLSRRAKVHERDVILRCDGSAVVYAHTAVPLSATATQWPLFAALGERSLGSTLFNDPQVVRDQLVFAKLSDAHPLFQRVVAAKVLEHIPQYLLARRSVFWRKGGCLLVTEVFLPEVKILRQR